MRPSRIARNQEKWLVEHLPEASIDGADFDSLLVEEIAASQPKRQPTPTTSASQFCVGKIADLRETDVAAKGHPVLAVASGVAGNVLRLISLAREEWAWAEADIKVRVNAPNLQLEGEWCQDDIPITSIKFVIDAGKYDPIRWLLVQNGVSTVLYEPELRAIPMPASGAPLWASGRPVASQIFANPLVTIPYEHTGGGLQSDACFSRNSETDTPKLVIIDQRGSWSIWDIKGRRDVRPKVLTPVMRMCGNTVLGSTPQLLSSPVTMPSAHTIMFLSLGHEKSRPQSRRSRTRSPSEACARSEAALSQNPRLLLLCNPRAMHLFDLAAGRSQSVSHMVLSRDTHRILGMAQSRLNPSQAFILTTTNLLWVAAKEGSDGTVTLDILVSCAHQKDINDPTFQLDVSPGTYIDDLKACFVGIRSTRDTEITIFWFINPEGAPVRYHRDIISLQSPFNFVGLHIVPVGRRLGDGPITTAGRAMREAQLRFFQVLTLGRDLGVHSALCAWSDERNLSVAPPDTRESLEEGGNRRLELLRDLTRAFAVPDEFDERAVFGKRGPASPALGSAKVGIESRADFELAAQRLSAVGNSPAGVADGVGSLLDDRDFSFIGEAIERERHDGYMPRHSLYVLPLKKYWLQLLTSCQAGSGRTPWGRGGSSPARP